MTPDEVLVWIIVLICAVLGYVSGTKAGSYLQERKLRKKLEKMKKQIEQLKEDEVEEE